MQLRRFDDPAAFSEQVMPFLLSKEAEHNLQLGLIGNLVRGTDEYPQPPYMALVARDHRVVAVALRTPPFKLIVSMVAPEDHDALKLITQDVRTVFELLPGVSGHLESATAFAHFWETTTGQRAVFNMPQRIYKLQEVQMPRGVAGEYRPATHVEFDLLMGWYAAFYMEALGEQPDPAHMRRAITNYLKAQGRGLRVWWDDGAPVSMAGYTGFTQNGVRVGAVYTPPEKRKKGYASACVAAVSQELLDSGRKFCFLFTDLNNPTSNSIYQQIGYRPVCDVGDYRFERVSFGFSHERG